MTVLLYYFEGMEEVKGSVLMGEKGKNGLVQTGAAVLLGSCWRERERERGTREGN